MAEGVRQKKEGETAEAPTRVLIVDDHQAILLAMKVIVDARRPRMEVAGTASGREEALAAVTRDCPDVVLLDLELGGESGLDLLPELLRRCGDAARVIVLTGSRDTSLHDRAVRLGARGVLLKHEPLEDVVKAIEKVMRGELWLDRATSARVLAEFAGRGAGGDTRRHADPGEERAGSLTPREREVVALVGEGLTNGEIADRLFVSEKTVRNNLTVVYDKLGVANRLGLILFAQRHGLAERPNRDPAPGKR